MTTEECRKKYGWYPANHLIKDGIVVCFECLKNEAEYWDHRPGTCVLCENAAKNRAYDHGFGGITPEFVPDSLLKERERFAPDMVQSHRQGELSREYVEVYPEKVASMMKDGVLSRDEVKNSKYVWGKDIKGWRSGRKADASDVSKYL